MADNHTPDFETRTRGNLAYGLLAVIAIMIGYCLFEYGHILAVLTLILGWLTGTANVLLSPYFGSPTAAKKADAAATSVTGDSPTVNVTPAPEQPTNTNT